MGLSDKVALAGDAGGAGLIPVSERSLEEGTATHTSILAWSVPGTEAPGGLQSTGCRESDRPEAAEHAETVVLLVSGDYPRALFRGKCWEKDTDSMYVYECACERCVWFSGACMCAHVYVICMHVYVHFFSTRSQTFLFSLLWSKSTFKISRRVISGRAFSLARASCPPTEM